MAQPISASSRDKLWAFWDEHFESVSSRNTLPQHPDLAALVDQLGISRSQTKRQWDRWRRGRREEVEVEHASVPSASDTLPYQSFSAHEHSGSIHAHRRRAFGADDTLHNRLHSIHYDAQFVARIADRFRQTCSKFNPLGLSKGSCERGQLSGNWPLVVNLRCGAWYVSQEERRAAVHFKSGDGHSGKWAFSLRRLNFHVLNLLVDCNGRAGIILVDSTRRGRLMPDSFAKTVPIWCAVVNRAVAIERGYCRQSKGGERGGSSGSGCGDAWCTALRLPPCVGVDERVAIEAKMDGFVAELSRLIYGSSGPAAAKHSPSPSSPPPPPVPKDSSSSLSQRSPPFSPSAAVLQKLEKPLRPFWLTPKPTGDDHGKATGKGRGEDEYIGTGDAGELLRMLEKDADLCLPYYPVVCLSASEPLDRRCWPHLGFTYLQGCADDEEDWAILADENKNLSRRGGGDGRSVPRLTAELFWAHRSTLLAADRDLCTALARTFARKAATETAAAADDDDAATDLGLTNAGADAAVEQSSGSTGGRPSQCGGDIVCVTRVQTRRFVASSAASGAARHATEGVDPSLYDWVVRPPPDSLSSSAFGLAVGGRRAGRPPACWETFDAVVNVTLEEYEGMLSAIPSSSPSPSSSHSSSSSPSSHSSSSSSSSCTGLPSFCPSYLHCPVAEGKRDRRGLEAHLPRALRFVAWNLSRGRRVLVHCAQGKDRSVAVAVAVLAALFDDEGRVLPPERLARVVGKGGGGRPLWRSGETGAGEGDLNVHEGGGRSGYDTTMMERDAELRAEIRLGPERTKRTITRCVSWVLLARPVASPSRHTLKKLHRFFSGMDDGGIVNERRAADEQENTRRPRSKA